MSEKDFDLLVKDVEQWANESDDRGAIVVTYELKGSDPIKKIASNCLVLANEGAMSEAISSHFEKYPELMDVVIRSLLIYKKENE